jgi:excisionase family DNA binding protein
MNPNLLVAQEAAPYLRVKLSTLYAWVHQRKIPFRKHGRKLIFSKEDLNLWSREQQTVHGFSVAGSSISCYSTRSKDVSLKTEKTKQRANQTSVFYDPFSEGGSS